MSLFTIITGSNSGNKQEILTEALAELVSRTGKLIKKSFLYETEPWGFECSELFLNQVAVIDSDFSPEDFLNICQDIENKFGRERIPDIRYSSRTLDIDILFFNSEIIHLPHLIIPHPRLHERNFVLVPLNALMPEFEHPFFHKKIKDLLSESPDKLKVSKKV